MAVEAIASAPIFASMNETGLVSGYVTAVVMSALNAVIGFLGGFFGVRYTTHSKPVMKTLGYGAAMISVAVAIAFNLFMALWRASASEPAIPGDATPAFALLATGPSLTLLMLGGIVFLMALYEGATKFGEVYPEYGKMERHAQAAEEDFRDALDEAMEELHEHADPAIAAINERLDAQQAGVAKMLEVYDETAGRLIALDARLRALAAAQSSLIALYRQENVALRKGAAPRAFLTPPSAPPAPEDVLVRAGAMLTEARDAFTRAQTAANAESAGLIRELREISARLEGAP